MNDSSFLAIRPAADLLAAAPVRPFLLEPILAPGTIGLIYGQPGVGKSFLALGLALAAAGGSSLFGWSFELRLEKARHRAAAGVAPIEAQLCTGDDGLARWQWLSGESRALRQAAPLLQQGMSAEVVGKVIGVSPRTAYRLRRRRGSWDG